MTDRLSTTVNDMRDHWVWRPEWTPERTCLYWYLVFRGDDVATALGDEVPRAIADVDWLDGIPPQWCHVTLTDVGFTDEVDAEEVERVTAAVADAVADESPLPLRLGPVRSWNTAVVLPAEPADRLHAIRSTARRVSTTALAPTRPTRSEPPDQPGRGFRPHVSIGYVNRAVDAATVSALLDRLPEVDVRLDVDALTLAAVTRRDHGYRWEVAAEIPLAGSAG